MIDKEGRGPTQRAVANERQKWEGQDIMQQTELLHPDVSLLDYYYLRYLEKII